MEAVRTSEMSSLQGATKERTPIVCDSYNAYTVPHYGNGIEFIYVLTAVTMKMAAFWVVAPCKLVWVYLMIEAVQTSETSVNSYWSTRRCSLEENLILIELNFKRD
jgi:hypothetical protein